MVDYGLCFCSLFLKVHSNRQGHNCTYFAISLHLPLHLRTTTSPLQSNNLKSNFAFEKKKKADSYGWKTNEVSLRLLAQTHKSVHKETCMVYWHNRCLEYGGHKFLMQLFRIWHNNSSSCFGHLLEDKYGGQEISQKKKKKVNLAPHLLIGSFTSSVNWEDNSGCNLRPNSNILISFKPIKKILKNKRFNVKSKKCICF